MPSPCVRVVTAPRLLRTAADAEPLRRQLEQDHCSVDLIVDLRTVSEFDDAAARLVRDLVFWRVHWSRIGCLADGEVARVLTSMHVDQVIPVGTRLPDVLNRMLLDGCTPPGGRRLLMGPGPAAVGVSA